MSDNTTTKQVKTLKNGNPINVSRQFGQPNGNPRHNGMWKKEATPRYKLEKMMTLTHDELEDIVNDNAAPEFERKIAKAILKDEDFTAIERMINQVYGKPAQAVVTVDVNDEDTKDAFIKGVFIP